MQDVRNHRGAPLYSGTPVPSSGLICANFFDCSDFYNRPDGLLSQGGLLKFTNASRTLSEVWFGGKEPDELSLQMQEFLLHGGVYMVLQITVLHSNKRKKVGA